MKNKIRCYLLFITVLVSCRPEKNPEPEGVYSSGIFVVNEGIYGQTSGTVSYYNPDSAKLLQNIFRLSNDRDLGNVLQSMYFHNDKVYLVVNNSNKIEIANAHDFKEIAQITNLEQPRYFLPIDADRALVTQWGFDLLSGSLALIDLNTNTLIQQISSGIGKGPENMLLNNGKVFICNVGGLESDNFISVLNLQTMQVEDTIITDDAPNSMQIAPNGNIWIACSGKAVYASYPVIDTVNSTYGSLLELDPSTGNIINRIVFQKGKGATRLILGNSSGQMFFLYDNAICRLNTTSSQYSLLTSGSFYGIGAKNGDDAIYASVNSGIQSAKVYRIRSADAVRTDSFSAGIFANAILFK